MTMENYQIVLGTEMQQNASNKVVLVSIKINRYFFKTSFNRNRVLI
jgi:hypothetical protein